MPGAWHDTRQPDQPAWLQALRAGQPPPQQTAPTGLGGGTTSGGGVDLMGATQDWWDLAGWGSRGGGGFMNFQAPSVRAPKVKAPEIPQTPEVTPGKYTGDFPDEAPKSPFEDLIDKILIRRPEPAPPMTVDADFVNDIIQQYGLEPRSPEEIREAAQAVVERQAFQKDQIVQRELDRFEREYPSEFRKAQQDIMNAAKDMEGEMQEEAAARGMFYSSVMASGASALNEQVLEHISDIANAAASRVAFLRDEQRDIEEWSILEEEVVFRQMEAVDRQERQQLMHMQVEVATWADQMNLDRWYRHEQLMFQHDQLELAGIQMKIQEAERMGQHYATALMADHPLVQGTLENMGISPEHYNSLDMTQQASLVNQIVGFNEVEQAMRQREFQMRAAVAEIQLQNAALQLQASIASGQFQMQAMGMRLQYAMHHDQMGLAWAGHALDATALQHGMEMDRLRLSRMGSGTAQQPGLDYGMRDIQNAVALGDTAGLGYLQSYFRQHGAGDLANYAGSFLQQQQAPAQQQTPSFFGPGGTADSWLESVIGLPRGIQAPM